MTRASRLAFVIVSALCAPAISATVVESPMGDRTFMLMYEPVTGGQFPQLVVFDPSGRCVGTLGEGEGQDPVQKVRDAVAAGETACPLITSDEFGATGPGGEGAPGVSVVELIIVKPDFCSACRDWRDRLVEAFGEDDSVVVRVREVGG